MPKIATTDVKVWLKEALEEYDEHGVEKDTYYYYNQHVKTELGFVLKTIRKRLARADKEQKLTLKSVFVEGVDEVVKSVFSEADKNYGTVLIECKDIAEAEKRVLRELGGHRVDLNVDEALDAIDKKLLEFEVNLKPEQILALNSIQSERRKPREKVVLPFVRLNCKIHKATKEDLENRNVERLNYRPIQVG